MAEHVLTAPAQWAVDIVQYPGGSFSIDILHIPLKTAMHPGSKPPAIAIQKQHRFRFGEGQ